MEMQYPPKMCSQIFRPWDTTHRNVNLRSHQVASATVTKSAFNFRDRYQTPTVPTPAPAEVTVPSNQTIKTENGAEEEKEEKEVNVDTEEPAGSNAHNNRDCPSTHSSSSQNSHNSSHSSHCSSEEDLASTSQTTKTETTANHAPTTIMHMANARARLSHAATAYSNAKHVTWPATAGVFPPATHLLATGSSLSAPMSHIQFTQQQQMLATTAATATAMANDYFYAAGNGYIGNPLVPPTSFSSTTAATANFMGMGAYTYNLMEQEYVRVMAEEAHLKAVNARKQRPKKFKCPHCDVAFSNNGQLKGHIRIHTGERPYKCDEPKCGKSFTRNEELTRHKRIHSGIRPYECPVCEKRFGRRDHLKKHTKTHVPQDSKLGQAIFVSMYPPYMYL